jgi:protein-L-isoaspartate(D-aspartate) O-methyltransferase
MAARQVKPRSIDPGRAAGTLLLVLLVTACGGGDAVEQAAGERDPIEVARQRMVDEQLRRAGIKDPAVLRAMGNVPRHEFLPESQRPLAYTDQPLPISQGQTISQPYIVALMTEVLELKPGESVLEIGTGSGYQAAVLAEITDRVYSIEILEPLAVRARETLQRLGYRNVHVRLGDGYRGWPEYAPFDAIVVTAAPDHIPQPLVDQLKVGGRMVIPIGSYYQELILLRKGADGNLTRQGVIPVRFVPMVGEAETVPPPRP